MANFKSMNKVMKDFNYLGIDISKKTIDASIFDCKSGKTNASLHSQFTNDESGYKLMISWLKKQGISTNDFEVCMEATGMYTLGLCEFLEDKGIPYKVVDPRHLKLSMGFVKGKNDKVDSQRIAYYAYLHRDEKVYSKISSRTVMTLRELENERKQIVVDMARSKAFFTEYKKSRFMDKRILKREETEYAQHEVRLKECEKQMQDLIISDDKLFSNYKLILSVKGIGKVNAINTIINTDNFTLFDNARQYASYLGIAPFERSSGTSVHGRTHVLPGAKIAKADLSGGAKSAVLNDAEIRDYYNRKTAEGKAYGVVLNAIKFKLVERMFATIKRGTDYVDLKTYKKTSNNKKENNQKKTDINE